MEISVIIPTFNEELTIEKTLEALSRLQNVSEVIIVDGGSADRTVEIIENFQRIKNLKLIKFGVANRGRQLHEGTLHAAGDIFWFIHADSRPVQGSGRQIKALMRYKEVVGGNFNVVFSGASRWARFLTWLYPHLRAINLAYGDSAIFARRETYERIKGYKPLPLFEDVDLYKRLQKRGRFIYVNLPITTSSRRFENRSFVWTFLKWSILQGLYWIGFPPRLLAKSYKQIR
jgi:rSAM/selenodomain-associated transferase 2